MPPLDLDAIHARAASPQSFGYVFTHYRQDVLAMEQEILRLRAERDKYREALRKIAKPAIGGKQQQYTAQAALTPSGGRDA